MELEKKVFPVLHSMLESADLEALSRKMVRTQLEKHFDCSLEEYKKQINEEIVNYIQRMQADDNPPDAEDEDTTSKPKRKAVSSSSKASKKRKTAASGAGSAFQAPVMLSPELSQVLNADELPRPQVVKQMWDYIKEHNLQDPADRRKIVLDEALERVFQRKEFTMFSMNKYLKPHLVKREVLEAEGGWEKHSREAPESDDEEEKARKKQASLAKRAATRAKKAKKGTKTTRTSDSKTGINRPLHLSAELTAVVQETMLSRPQVVKKLWEYIKANDLQNPDNRQQILCDDKLEALFQVKEISMFAMNKQLKHHFVTPSTDATPSDQHQQPDSSE